MINNYSKRKFRLIIPQKFELLVVVVVVAVVVVIVVVVVVVVVVVIDNTLDVDAMTMMTTTSISNNFQR